MNRLVLIGNGFDLAHGLKTSYRNFMDWYMCQAYYEFCEKNYYNDELIEINYKYSGMHSKGKPEIKCCEDVLNIISCNNFQDIRYNSNFFQTLLDTCLGKKWVDIECYYFEWLKNIYDSPGNQKEKISKLNTDFDIIILKLSEYINSINDNLLDTPKLNIKNTDPLYEILLPSNNTSIIKFLNFNYTDTLNEYVEKEEIINIHGNATDIEKNPIIFGYGDETDPAYQKFEDTGENLYLQHIKSFGYFRTPNYQNLISFLDSNFFSVYIMGHSCGLSDRVLLNEIFEHTNCTKIEIFYHVLEDGNDNFKEITQQISRHFKPQNKNLMRRRVWYKMENHIIPQNKPG